MLLFRRNFTEIVHSMMREKIKEGDTVIDGTVGNGGDTLFLAEMVGTQGKVIGFDIQRQAIERTAQKLREQNLDMQVQLVQDSHGYIDQYVTGKIQGAMYNLGYLPGGDRQIITRPETTIRALQQTLSLLVPGGLITIISYYGHEGGLEEKTAVEGFLKAQNTQHFTVMRLDFINRSSNPPLIYLIERIG